jgi:hypothetical protein
MNTGQHRKRLEKAGIFQPRGEKKTPPVVIKVRRRRLPWSSRIM